MTTTLSGAFEEPSGDVVVDLRAIQSPDHRGRGIGQYAYELATGIERVRPDLVSSWMLDPAWPPPGSCDELLGTGKLDYSDSERAHAALSRARVFHSMSPFELGAATGQVWPPFVEQRSMRFCASVYDLIPLKMSEIYLVHPAQRRRYHVRLEVLKNADALCAISGATAQDLVKLLEIPPERTQMVGTGVSPFFAPPGDPGSAGTAALCPLPGIKQKFVLYPGGNDVRKNIEELLLAFSILDERLRDSYQLVIAGDLPPLTANHYRHIASRAGIEAQLFLAGHVSQDVLRALYRSATLVCFPSLIEGFGLPVAEALACGTPAVVSDRPPMDELVPEAAGRFDPYDPADIASAMSRALTDELLRSELVSTGRAALATWDEVALRVSEVWDRLAAAPRRPWLWRRTLALVSPFPPILSGVADDTNRLLPELTAAAERATESSSGQPPISIVCFADGLDRDGSSSAVLPGPDGRRVFDARRLPEVEAAMGGFEQVCYVLGNSEFHTGALSALRHRAGLVVSHDVRMSGLLQFSADRPGAVPGGLAGAIRRNYGSTLPEGLGEDGLSDADEERYGLLLFRDILLDAERVLVRSESALRLAQLDAGAASGSKLGLLPFAVGRLTDSETQVVERSRTKKLSARKLAPSESIIVSFGIVNPSKQTDVLIAALAALTREGSAARLWFVGPVSTEESRRLTRLATDLGVGSLVELVGGVSWDRYLECLGVAGIAVQLRCRDSGEASATVSECLSAGLPAVVSRLGWSGSLDEDAVHFVDARIPSEDLAAELAELFRDPSRLARLGAAGRRYAERHTFRLVAEALAEELGWSSAPAG
ncbi:MAG: glycosyltransferase [Acidimicrobiales bacterium]